jgi:hypothetical protein
VRLLLDALPAQSALGIARMWGPLTRLSQGRDVRLGYTTLFQETLPDAVASCPPGMFRVAFFRATDARLGYAIKSHMKSFVAGAYTRPLFSST